MMNNINLFVVCPKDSEALNKQKELIKKACLNLNIDYACKGRKTKIIPVTYYDRERKEEVGKTYIKNKADIVIFLVDEELDKSLEDQLKLAVKRSRRWNKPDIWVCIPANNPILKEKIESILGTNGWIDTMPMLTPGEEEKEEDKETELKNRLKIRLTEYVRKYQNTRLKQKTLRALYYIIIAISALAIVGYFLYYLANEPRVLIVGGGSARSYIVNTLLDKKDKSLSDAFRLYAPMPSGDSYRIMAEEIINNYEHYQKRPYYPVIISAQRAKPDKFKRNFSETEFTDIGIIIGIHLVDDWLVVYGSKNAIDSTNYRHDTIEAATLDSIIAEQIPLLLKRDSAALKKLPIIHTTSENSGTLNAYFSACGDTILNNYLHACDVIEEHHIFSDIDVLSKQNPGRDWIALGSHYYSPEKDKDSVSGKDEDILQLTLLNNKGTIEPKPIYVYFMLYKDKNKGGDNYVLPDVTKDFLEKIHINDIIIKSIQSIGKNDTLFLNDTALLKDPIFFNNSTILYDGFHNVIRKKQ